MKRTHVVDAYQYEEYAMELRVAPEVWAQVPVSDRKTIQQALWSIAEMMNQGVEDYQAVAVEGEKQNEEEASPEKNSAEKQPGKK